MKYHRLHGSGLQCIILDDDIFHGQLKAFITRSEPLEYQGIQFNFQSFEVLSRYLDTQFQVTKNLCDLQNLSPTIYQCFKIESIFYF